MIDKKRQVELIVLIGVILIGVFYVIDLNQKRFAVVKNAPPSGTSISILPGGITDDDGDFACEALCSYPPGNGFDCDDYSFIYCNLQPPGTTWQFTFNCWDQ